MFIRNIDSVRQVEFSRQYLWDCMIKGAPSPFDQWFPAKSVSDPVSMLAASKSLMFDLVPVAFPSSIGIKKMAITYYDDYMDSLLDFFKEWSDGLVDYSNGVVPLEDAVKQMVILKLAPDRQVIKQSYYWVFPDTSMSDELTSNSELKLHRIEFVVAGEQHYKFPHSFKSLISSANKQFDVVQLPHEFNNINIG